MLINPFVFGSASGGIPNDPPQSNLIQVKTQDLSGAYTDADVTAEMTNLGDWDEIEILLRDCQMDPVALPGFQVSTDGITFTSVYIGGLAGQDADVTATQASLIGCRTAPNALYHMIFRITGLTATSQTVGTCMGSQNSFPYRGTYIDNQDPPVAVKAVRFTPTAAQVSSGTLEYRAKKYSSHSASRTDLGTTPPPFTLNTGSATKAVMALNINVSSGTARYVLRGVAGTEINGNVYDDGNWANAISSMAENQTLHVGSYDESIRVAGATDLRGLDLGVPLSIVTNSGQGRERIGISVVDDTSQITGVRQLADSPAHDGGYVDLNLYEATAAAVESFDLSANPNGVDFSVAGWDEAHITILNAQRTPDYAGVDFLQVSTDGGLTWFDGASDYRVVVVFEDGRNSSLSTGIGIVGRYTTGGGCSAVVSGIPAGSTCSVLSDSVATLTGVPNRGAHSTMGFTTGTGAGTAAITNLRLIPGSGTFSAGTLVVEKIGI